jgi:hypothetical protein
VRALPSENLEIVSVVGLALSDGMIIFARGLDGVAFRPGGGDKAPQGAWIIARGCVPVQSISLAGRADELTVILLVLGACRR